MSSFNQIGKPLPLKEGEQKSAGRTQYAPDLRLPGMLYARFVTSPYAHARLLTIETEAALAVPDVVAVLTAADLPSIPPRNRYSLMLARERLLFVGQPVALVLAESEVAAEDGAAEVFVDAEALPAAVTIDQALAPDAPSVWPYGVPSGASEAGAHGTDVEGDTEEERQGNVVREKRYGRGDIDAGFAAADIIVEATFTTAGVHQNYLEPHATIAMPDPVSGGVTVWTSTQAPFYVRGEIASLLDITEGHVRVIPTPVGGAFGGKFILYEPLVALAAFQTGRPVRLVLTRGEELLAANPVHPARVSLRLGATVDGDFTALQGSVLFDGGIYPTAPASFAGFLIGSAYRVPHLDIQTQEVLTFKPSCGAYRAPGAPQAFFALESLIDELAEIMDHDPLALRLRNAARPGEPMANGDPWPSMGMVQVLEALAAHPTWQEREHARARGRGVGVAVGGWPGGTQGAAATCMLNRDGFLEVHLGTVDLTGTSTGFALMAAETFGVEPSRVRIVQGDTANAPFVGATGGSKITYTVGPAVIQAAEQARIQLLEIASEEFEADPADLEIVDGEVRVRGVPDKTITLAALAEKTMDWSGRYAPIVGNGRHAETEAAPGFCAQLAEVSVDEETGQVQVERLVVVQDVGRAINPLAIQGQMMGGATQGIGWALYEALAYDEQGQLLSGSWMDYAVPRTLHAAPEIETVCVEVPTDRGPFGARGVGEPPVIATAAAVANAVADATGRRMRNLPITAERLARAMDGQE